MVPISPQVYSAEAVVFDTKPLFDYAQKLDERRAKRALAEQEAIDKYVEQTQKNLTPTGMRSQDIPGFQKMQDEFRSLANQYKNTKDPIKRFQLQKKGDEMFLYIQKSKEEEKKAEPARTALANPENRKKLNVPKMMEALSVHDLPLDFQGVPALGIPQRRSIDPNATYFRETPFSFKENFDKAATGPGIKFSEISITSGGKVNKITEGFNKSTIKSIASNFVDLVDADEDKKSYYTIRARDPQIYPSQKLAEYDKKVKEYFPDITVDDDDWRSIALAEAIKEAEKRNAEKFENAPKISVSTGEVKKGEVLDVYKEIDLATSSPQRLKSDKGAPVDILSATAQIALINLANKVTGKKDYYNQSNIYVKKFSDGKNYIVDFKTDKPLVPFTKQDINIPTQVDVAAERTVVSQAKTQIPQAAPKKEISYLIKGKTYKQSQLLSMYTQDQINEALKAGTVKIKK